MLHIAEPFWGAYSIYGWESPIPGIGINKKLVKKAKLHDAKIYITIGSDPQIYQISPITVENLGKKYKSEKVVRAGVRVIVIPRSELKKRPEYIFENGIAKLPLDTVI